MRDKVYFDYFWNSSPISLIFDTKVWIDNFLLFVCSKIPLGFHSEAAALLFNRVKNRKKTKKKVMASFSSEYFKVKLGLRGELKRILAQSFITGMYTPDMFYEFSASWILSLFLLTINFNWSQPHQKFIVSIDW